MFNQTIYSGLVNIVPFWSSNLIQIYGLGNEYNVAFNLILTEVLKMCTLHLTELMWILLILLILLILTLKKIGFVYDFNFWETNMVILNGKEIESSNSNTIEYCNKIKSINRFLLEELKIKNITYTSNSNILINNVKDFKVSPNINLTITRTGNQGDQQRTVSYTFWSYKENINLFLNEIIKKYKCTNNYELVLIGSESGGVINYPLPIDAINSWVSQNYNFPKLKCLKNVSSQIASSNDTNNNNNNSKEENKDNKEQTVNSEYTYTLDNISNFEIDAVKLTITRDNGHVYYHLKSDKICCKQWVENKITFYNQNKAKFKNRLVLSGSEVISYTRESNKAYCYVKLMWVINWYVIEKLGFQNYECVVGDHINPYRYILEPLDLFELEEDLFLTIKKVAKNSGFSNQDNDKNAKVFRDLDVLYILNSNTKTIKDVLDRYSKEYDDIKSKVSVNKIIYHFTYNGTKGQDLVFQHKILSEENTDKELFETFDKLHNEHVPVIKRDIDKLRDLEYYRTHGLKRKKGYLFHGIPGCGKTAMVVAMALYDSRHIVEVPFSLIKTHEEFTKLMNLKTINGIEVNNNNIIILFDEIDIGMEKIGSRNSTDKDTSMDPAMAVVGAISKMIESEHTPYDSNKLNLGTLLSKLDGIGNYNGLIIVGTTNCIHKLDSALYRELRLTPIEFRKLRKVDCIQIIESYFGKIVDNELFDVIKDFKVTPAKLITMCQVNEHLSIYDFFKNVLSVFFTSAC